MHGIDARTSCEATAIDPKQKTVALRNVTTGEETIELNGARIATQWESATYEYDASVWPTFKNCRLVIKLWTSAAVPTGLVRKTEDRTCPLGGDQLARVMVETYLQSFEGFTLTASTLR